jgi:RNA polymerase sigma-70 factor (ECF subfamily)
MIRSNSELTSAACSIVEVVDTAPTNPGDLVLPLVPAQQSTETVPAAALTGIALGVIEELWIQAEADTCDLSLEEFGTMLASIGAKLNYGVPADTRPNLLQKTAFFRSLHLSELALAHACALGREAAWQRFIVLYRAPLLQAAIAITRSDTLGRDLAESLYAELYGLREAGGQRRSPLASYSGRGSLLGWLRTTLAQRHVDHHRHTHRETPLDSFDAPAPEHPASPIPHQLTHLHDAVAQTLESVAAEDRFLLAAYFLDGHRLLEIARLLRVHEATVSRRLKRLVADMRKQLLQNLQSGGLSKRAAEEALGADPRDIEINLRALLQLSQTSPFSDKAPTTAAQTQP